MSRTRASTYTTHSFYIDTIESAPTRFAFATGQRVYIRAVYTDHAAGFTRRATPVVLPISNFFARPRPVIRHALSELFRHPEPPRSLLDSFEHLAETIALILPGNPTHANAPVVPLVIQIDVRPIPGAEADHQGSEFSLAEDRELLDQVADFSLAEVESRLYAADESAIEAMIEAAESGGAYGDGYGDERCAICLEDFGARTVYDDDHDGEKIVPMPCSHVYHKECIVEWLKRNHRCPLCRFPMPVAAT